MNKILVVDDNPDMRMIFKEVLEDAGYEVVVFEEATIALGQIDPTYDAIVTDYQMPEMNGLEFTKAVRNVMPEIPILMCSAISCQIVGAAKEAGVSILMDKSDMHSGGLADELSRALALY